MSKIFKFMANINSIRPTILYWYNNKVEDVRNYKPKTLMDRTTTATDKELMQQIGNRWHESAK
ncbi:MAG: hypothetical protein U5K54_13345 [Cytophagales bacterium]|nr:hypothetical protein [Cytophagales bacterium]